MRVAVCTDDDKCRETICEYAKQDTECTIRCFSSIFGFVTYICDDVRGELDALFMDEEVGGENGIEAAYDIQMLFPELKVVFFTQGLCRAEEFFIARPLYLLSKPISAQAVVQAMKRIELETRQQEGQVLTLTFRGCLYRISTQSIYYIESQGRKLYLYTTGLLREVNMTMEEIEEKLPENFYRCHRSYIINLERVRNVMPREVELNNNRVLPISRSRYEELTNKFKHMG